jgi:hypothetical protein
MKEKYDRDILKLQSYVEQLEQKIVQLYTELNGEENLDELELPEFSENLTPLEIPELPEINISTGVIKTTPLKNNREPVPPSNTSVLAPDANDSNTSFSPKLQAKSPIKKIIPNGEFASKKKSDAAALSNTLNDNRVLRVKLSQINKVKHHMIINSF